jgi:hypothetical protein
MVESLVVELAASLVEPKVGKLVVQMVASMVMMSVD